LKKSLRYIAAAFSGTATADGRSFENSHVQARAAVAA
jgi:hypothetical protein